MTVTTTATSSGPYTGTGASGQSFPVTFHSAGADQIKVWVDGIEVSSNQYVFNRNADGTGTVVATLTGTVNITSAPAFLQPVDFQRYGPYFPDDLNGPLDASVVRDLYLLSMIESIPEIDVAASAAAAAASAAAAHADKLAADADTMATSADRAQTALNAAAAAVGAQVYSTEAAGRAAVADGQQFRSMSADGGSVEVRSRVNSGSSTLIASYPTTPTVQTYFNTAGLKSSTALTRARRFDSPRLVHDLPAAGTFAAGRLIASVMLGAGALAQRGTTFNSSGAAVTSGNIARIQSNGGTLLVTGTAPLGSQTYTNFGGERGKISLPAEAYVSLKAGTYLTRLLDATSVALVLPVTLDLSTSTARYLVKRTSVQLYANDTNASIILRKVSGGSSATWTIQAGLTNLGALTKAALVTLVWDSSKPIESRATFRVNGADVAATYAGTGGYLPTALFEAGDASGDMPLLGDPTSGSPKVMDFLGLDMWINPTPGEVEASEAAMTAIVATPPQFQWTRPPRPHTGIGRTADEYWSRTIVIGVGTPDDRPTGSSWSAVTLPTIDKGDFTDWPLSVSSTPNVIATQNNTRSDTSAHEYITMFTVMPDPRDPTNASKAIAIACGGRVVADANGVNTDYYLAPMAFVSTNADAAAGSDVTFTPWALASPRYSMPAGTTDFSVNNMIGPLNTISTGATPVNPPQKVRAYDSDGVLGTAGAWVEVTAFAVVVHGAYNNSNQGRLQVVALVGGDPVMFDIPPVRNPMGYQLALPDGSPAMEFGSPVGPSPYLNGTGIQETKSVLLGPDGKFIVSIRPQFNVPHTPVNGTEGSRQTFNVTAAVPGLEGLRYWDVSTALPAAFCGTQADQVYLDNKIDLGGGFAGMVPCDHFGHFDLGETGVPLVPVTPTGTGTNYLGGVLTFYRNRDPGNADWQIIADPVVDTVGAGWKFPHNVSFDERHQRLYMCLSKRDHGDLVEGMRFKVVSKRLTQTGMTPAQLRVALRNGVPHSAVIADGTRREITMPDPVWGGNVDHYEVVATLGAFGVVQVGLLDAEAYERGVEEYLPGYDPGSFAFNPTDHGRGSWSNTMLNTAGHSKPPNRMYYERFIIIGPVNYNGIYRTYTKDRRP